MEPVESWQWYDQHHEVGSDVRDSGIRPYRDDIAAMSSRLVVPVVCERRTDRKTRNQASQPTQQNNHADKVGGNAISSVDAEYVHIQAKDNELGACNCGDINYFDRLFKLASMNQCLSTRIFKDNGFNVTTDFAKFHED